MLERLIKKIVKVYVDPANSDDGLEGLRRQAVLDCVASRDTQVCSSGKELSLGHRTGSPVCFCLTHTLPRGPLNGSQTLSLG